MCANVGCDGNVDDLHMERAPYGVWLFVAPGSGVYVNVGRSLRLPGGRTDAAPLFEQLGTRLGRVRNGTWREASRGQKSGWIDTAWCAAAMAHGYDSLLMTVRAFTANPASCPPLSLIDGPCHVCLPDARTAQSAMMRDGDRKHKRVRTAVELVVCTGGVSSTECSACPHHLLLRTGPNASLPCVCDSSQPILNCGGLRPSRCAMQRPRVPRWRRSRPVGVAQVS